VILVLGGTGDAKRIAQALIALDMPLIYSIAGLVRVPDINCEILVGGFSQHGGLAKVMQQRGVSLLIDATHPFAAQMSHSAAEVSRQLSVPCWRLVRQSWQLTQRHRLFSGWSELLNAITHQPRVLFTSGQLPERVQQAVLEQRFSASVLRTAVAPPYLPMTGLTTELAIGPFGLEQELALLQKHRIELLISKNSGGAPANKLIAAELLNIPVWLLQPPVLPPVSQHFNHWQSCVDAVVENSVNEKNFSGIKSGFNGYERG
jgi:precorrin-6A/cobalt-precorrin-6A reductase